MDKTQLKSIQLATIYVEDFEKNYEFYEKVLGLKKAFDMNQNSCFFYLGDENFGLYLEGGNKKTDVDIKTSRISFAFSVESAFDLFEKLKLNNVKIIQESPVDMGNNEFWFQFCDPEGNILEVIG